MASDDETGQESQGTASGDTDVWAVVEILAEKGTRYRVQWDGIDPDTGKPWPPSWIPKKDANQALVNDWKEKKARKAKRRRRSKSNTSKAAPRSRTSTSSTVRNAPSITPSTSTSAPTLRKQPSVISISSIGSSPPLKAAPSRKRPASPDGSTNGPDAVETPRPLKKRKTVAKAKDALITSPVQGASQSSYEVVQNKKFGKALPPQEEESDEPPVASGSASKSVRKGKGKQTIPAHNSQQFTDDEEPIPTRAPDPSPPKSILRSRGPKSLDGSGRTSDPSSSSKKKGAVVIGRTVEFTPNTRLRLREEEEENTQEAVGHLPQEATPAEPEQVPHLNLSSIGRSHPRKRRILQPEETIDDIQVSVEDISIPQRDHDNLPGIQFDLQDDYIPEPDNLSDENTKESHTPPSSSHISAVRQRPLSPPPSTPINRLSRNGNTASLLISRMKGNQSISGPPSSPTQASKNPMSSQTNGTMTKNTKRNSRKTLRSLPAVTPSKFAAHLPQLDPPVSSIEDFTPDKTRSSKKNLSTETDEIVDPDDSLVTDQNIRQRGQELAERAAAAKRQERAAITAPRRPLPPPASSPVPEAPSPVEFTREQSEDDLLQEMEDQYVDLSGGFPEEDQLLPNGTTKVIIHNVSPRQIVVHARQLSEEVELPPTESIQANTDSQGRSQDSEIGKSQYLNNAISLLHSKSEEIESLKVQISEQLAQFSALHAEFERLQAEHDALVVHKEVQGDALTEAKEYVKTLGNHADSLEQKNESVKKEMQELLREREEERDAWRVERDMLIDERDELAKRTAEPDQGNDVPIQDEEWSQKQVQWEVSRDAWLCEQEGWSEKEKLWSAEKEEWREKLESWEKEREKLNADVQSARKDNDFFREQQAQASSWAQSVRVENIQLSKENEEVKQDAAIAHGQARDGVKLVKDTYELRVKKLEEELDKAKRLCDLLKTKDERTNDEIRRRAGLYSELLEQNAQLLADLEEARAPPSRGGSDGEGSDHNAPSSPDDSLEYPPGEESENYREDSGVYLCEWARCGAAIETLQGLKEHTATHHGIRKLGVLFP